MYEEKHVKESPFVGMAGFGGGGTSTTLLSGGGESGWIMKLGGNVTNERLFGMAITRDSQDNLYLLADHQNNGAAVSTRAGNVSKYTKDGEIITYNGTDHWQRFFTTTTFRGQSIQVLSDDSKFYTAAYMEPNGSTNERGLIIEWLSNGFGTLSGIDEGSGGSSEPQYLEDMVLDSNDNIITCSYRLNGSGFDVIKWNSNLQTAQWSRTARDASSIGGERCYGIACDSNDNVFVVGTNQTPGTTQGLDDQCIVKYNSSGTFQWAKILGSAGWDNAGGVAVDSQDNIYVSGYADVLNDGNGYQTLVKYDTNGNVLWQKYYHLLQASPGIAIDSQDNIYTTTWSGSALIWFKFDTSGNLQTSQLLYDSKGTSGTSMGGNRITIDSEDNMYICGTNYTNNSTQAGAIIVKLPTSGALVSGGTYTTETPTITVNNSSLTAGTSAMTDTSFSLSKYSAGGSSNWSTYTATKTDL